MTRYQAECRAEGCDFSLHATYDVGDIEKRGLLRRTALKHWKQTGHTVWYERTESGHIGGTDDRP